MGVCEAGGAPCADDEDCANTCESFDRSAGECVLTPGGCDTDDDCPVVQCVLCGNDRVDEGERCDGTDSGDCFLPGCTANCACLDECLSDGDCPESNPDDCSVDFCEFDARGNFCSDDRDEPNGTMCALTRAGDGGSRDSLDGVCLDGLCVAPSTTTTSTSTTSTTSSTTSTTLPGLCDICGDPCGEDGDCSNSCVIEDRSEIIGRGSVIVALGSCACTGLPCNEDDECQPDTCILEPFCGDGIANGDEDCDQSDDSFCLIGCDNNTCECIDDCQGNPDCLPDVDPNDCLLPACSINDFGNFCDVTPAGAGAPCDDGIFCNGDDTCDMFDDCSNHNGDPCPARTATMICSEVCDETAGACSADDPNGTMCIPFRSAGDGGPAPSVASAKTASA